MINNECISLYVCYLIFFFVYYQNTSNSDTSNPMVVRVEVETFIMMVAERGEGRGDASDLFFSSVFFHYLFIIFVSFYLFK